MMHHCQPPSAPWGDLLESFVINRSESTQHGRHLEENWRDYVTSPLTTKPIDNYLSTHSILTRLIIFTVDILWNTFVELFVFASIYFNFFIVFIVIMPGISEVSA